MRIAVAGLHTECSTYNPVLAREADFTVLRGPSMLKSAYFDFLTHFPAEFITLLHARAIEIPWLAGVTIQAVAPLPDDFAEQLRRYGMGTAVS